MNFLRSTILLFLCIFLSSCNYQPHTDSTATVEQYQGVINIQTRDLILQSKTGNGEGLAKPVPGQPLLVNNQLIFSTMGDAVLGIAIAVGAIQQTIDKFTDMQPLQLEQTLETSLSTRTNNPQWQQQLSQLQSKKMQLILEPYCYLNGHPNAELEVRLHVILKEGKKVLRDKQLTKTSARAPVLGDNSWSSNKGEKVKQFSTTAIPVLLEQLQEQLSSGSMRTLEP
jgi:hypothetical protein